MGTPYLLLRQAIEISIQDVLRLRHKLVDQVAANDFLSEMKMLPKTKDDILDATLAGRRRTQEKIYRVHSPPFGEADFAGGFIFLEIGQDFDLLVSKAKVVHEFQHLFTIFE